ncbi:MAG: CpsD/CapB family tyrosine-protein kinase [Candidatus Binatia bacterium]
MSRVFDALAKASEEKKHQVKSIRRVVDTERQDSAQTKMESSLSEVLPGDRCQENLQSVSFTVTDKNKPWRERIEEFFLSWDLGRYQNHPIVSLEKDSAAAEQYKILREQIKGLRVEQRIDALSITSPVKRDGKTTVAVNLAAVLALDSEERVLLIDGDIRTPRVHRFFNLPLAPGFAEYLGSNSRMGVKSLVQETFLPGLSVLPAGKSCRLSSELSVKEKVRDVMDEIRADFPKHQIIIDTAPVFSTSEPLVIAGHLAGVLLVIRAGKTPGDYLTKAIQSLGSSKIIGVVLNGGKLGISSKCYYSSTHGASRILADTDS